MDPKKAETPEDEREISLNETSLKKPLNVMDVIGGHGPWQFRQWIVFFATSLCNATVLFSALFLPPQTYCFHENSTGIPMEGPASLEAKNVSASSEYRSFVRRNESAHPNSLCNSTTCKENFRNSSYIISSVKFPYEGQCWNSQIEIFARCSFIVAAMLSALLVYFSAERFGRRPLALVTCLFLVSSSLGSSWAGATSVFLILRFISSLGIASVYLISTLSLMEYVHKDFKLLYFFTGHLGWGVSHFFLPAVAWMAEDWMAFNIILGIVCVILSIFVWLSPESPSSFPNRGELTRSRKALKYAAFINGYSTTDVDMLSHNFRQRQESKHDLSTLVSPKAKIICFVYSSCLFLTCFTTAFLYFATKWHHQWFKVDGSRISFSFLGTTEVAATIILLFLTCLVPVKYLWACVSMMSSSLLIVIYSRNKGGSSRSSALIYTVTTFFASAAWALVMAKIFCHRISSTMAKLNLCVTAVAVFTGALFSSALVLKAANSVFLLVLAVPHFIFALSTAFLPDHCFGTVS